MLFVVAIIAILSVEGVYYVREANNVDVREYCKNLNGHLNNLYLESRFKRQEIKIVFDVDKNNILVTKGNVNNPNVSSNPVTSPSLLALPQNIKIASAKFSTINNQGQTLVYNGSVAPGSSAANNGTVTFEDTKNNNKCAIIQSLYGARRIE